MYVTFFKYTKEGMKQLSESYGPFGMVTSDLEHKDKDLGSVHTIVETTQGQSSIIAYRDVSGNHSVWHQWQVLSEPGGMYWDGYTVSGHKICLLSNVQRTTEG